MPLTSFRLPDSTDSYFGIPDNDVHEAVIIDIENSYAVVTAIGFTDWVSCQEMFCHELVHLAHVEKFHFFSMQPVGVVNDLDHLGITHPVASVETKRDSALLGYCCVNGSLVISDGYRILRTVQGLSGVIVGIDEGELPYLPAYHKGIRVVLDIIDEAPSEVAREAIRTSRVLLEENGWYLRVIRRKYHSDTCRHRYEISFRASGAEYF